MVFAASSVLVKCRLCASWEPGGGGERAGWAGVCFLDACLLGVCWWAWMQRGSCREEEGGSGSDRILLNKRFHAGWGQLNVPRWACARMPPSWLSLAAPLPLALVAACWEQCCLSVCHLYTPWTLTTPPLTSVLSSAAVRINLSLQHVYRNLPCAVYLLISAAGTCCEHTQLLESHFIKLLLSVWLAFNRHFSGGRKTIFSVHKLTRTHFFSRLLLTASKLPEKHLIQVGLAHTHTLILIFALIFKIIDIGEINLTYREKKLYQLWFWLDGLRLWRRRSWNPGDIRHNGDGSDKLTTEIQRQIRTGKISLQH